MRYAEELNRSEPPLIRSRRVDSQVGCCTRLHAKVAAACRGAALRWVQLSGHESLLRFNGSLLDAGEWLVVALAGRGSLLADGAVDVRAMLLSSPARNLRHHGCVELKIECGQVGPHVAFGFAAEYEGDAALQAIP